MAEAPIETDAQPLQPRPAPREETSIVPKKPLYIPPIPDDYDFTKLLLEIGTRITDADLKRIKCLFEGGSKRTFNQIESPMDLFRILKQQRYITPDNVFHLQAIVRMIADDNDIVESMEQIYEYSRKHKAVFFRPSTNEPPNGFRQLKFHVKGLEHYQQFNTEVANKLKITVASLTGINTGDVLLDGIQLTNSIYVTLLIPDRHYILFSALLKKGIPLLTELKIDMVTFEDGTTTNASDGSQIIEELPPIRESPDETIQRLKEVIDELENENICYRKQIEHLTLPDVSTGASDDLKPISQFGLNMATSISKSSEAASYCDPCQQIHKRTSNAVYFCAECRHELCSNCEDHHSKTLLTRNHRVTKLQDIDGKESDFQVSGRRPGGKAAKAGSVKGSDQCIDITQRVQGVTLSTGSRTSSTADRAGRVFKTASLKQGVNVSSESDAGLCEIRGIVLLQDRMIVSDRANSKLKVFDSDYTLQFEHKCDNEPYDINMVDNTTVVVSFRTPEMAVLSVGRDSMEKLVNINTEYPCLGVCCHDGKILCVVRDELNSQSYSEIREYTPNGTLTRKYDYLSDGKVGCNYLEYITVNPQTGTLYVTDWDKGVVALTTRGHVIAIMSPPQLKYPMGIAVDDHGHIYVCGCGSRKVIQISEDGSRVEELLSNNPRCKFAQCVKIYGNKMFFARRESDTVFIYELS